MWFAAKCILIKSFFNHGSVFQIYLIIFLQDEKDDDLGMKVTIRDSGISMANHLLHNLLKEWNYFSYACSQRAL